MECKKNPEIDLQKKRPLFLQIGLIISLSTILFAFEYKQYEKPPVLMPGIRPGATLEETVPLTQRHEDKPKPSEIRQIITTIDISDGKEDFDIGDIYWPEPLDNKSIADYVHKRKEEPSRPDNIPPLIVEIPAKFTGGDEALFQYLGENLRYPERAVQIGVQGIVYVRFVVELDGSITNVVIERGNLGAGCEEEAIAVVSKMPKWVPAKQRNRYVRSSFILPIEFRLMH